METILIVDDDPDMRSLYKLVLQKNGLTVTEAQNGVEALSKIDAEKPDLVLLDIMMPEMDGYEVCRRLRADPHTADLPVLMFSGKATGDARKNGLLAGANDFLAKTVGPRAVVDCVRSLLSKSLSCDGSAPAAISAPVFS